METAEVLPQSQYSEWDQFVTDAKGGTVFHKSWLLQAWTNRLEIRVLRDKSGQIEAGMAITPIRFLGTKAARRPAWTPYNGPLIRPSAKSNLVAVAAEEKNRMLRLLAQSPAMGMYDYILPPEYSDVMPFLWNGFEASVGYTYQIPPAAPEQWQAHMSSAHRRDLRKAHEVLRREKGSVEEDPGFAECCELISDTFEAKDFAVRAEPEELHNWWQAIIAHGAGKAYLAREANGEPVCASLLVLDHRCGYYLASGIRSDARSGPRNLWSRVLLDRMIRHTHRQGLTFDFEGSVLPGVERFFRGWGGRCVPKYRVVKIRRIWSYAGWVAGQYWSRHRRKRWFAY